MKVLNRKKHAVGLAVSLLMFCWFTERIAASPSDAFLNRLEGSWQGEGKAMGMSARMQMKWEWVLGKKFLRLSLKNEMRSAAQVQVFEGHAYYHSPTAGAYEGKWFDSRGAAYSIKATSDGEALIAFWGAPEQESGKSIYRLLETGKLEVVDSVRGKDGTWKEFGRFVLTRE